MNGFSASDFVVSIPDVLERFQRDDELINENTVRLGEALNKENEMSTETILEDVKPEPPKGPSAEQVFAALETAELRVGTVVEARPVPKSSMLCMTVSFGEAIGTRTILGNIGKFFQPEDLVGKQFLFVTNLPPRNMKGIDSEGMIFAAKDGDKVSLMTPTKPVTPGARIR